MNKEVNYSDNSSRTTLISEIILKDEKENYVIYSRYRKPDNKKKGFYLKDTSCLINRWNVKDLDISYLKVLEYVEIGNLQNNQIVGSFKKGKASYRIAKKGDILISSLTPSKQKVVLVEKDYKVSKAIHVLSFQNPIHRKYVYEYFLENKNDVFGVFNSLLDGFKITYSKISEFNLMNYVFFEGGCFKDELVFKKWK